MNTRSDRGSGEEATFTFVFPSKCDEKISYSNQKQRLIKAIEHHEWFKYGILFSTMEKGVCYPIIHMIEDDANNKKIFEDGYKVSPLHSDFTMQQGKYVEIRRMGQHNGGLEREPSYSSLDREFRDGPVSSPKNCIFLGYKSLESYFNEVLEDSWSDWTGARYIYLNMHDNFGLKNLRFFRRIHPNDISMFMYIVYAECTTINEDNKLAILDFVQRFRVDKMSGYISLYHQYDKRDSLVDGINVIIQGTKEIQNRNRSVSRKTSYEQHKSGNHEETTATEDLQSLSITEAPTLAPPKLPSPRRYSQDNRVLEDSANGSSRLAESSCSSTYSDQGYKAEDSESRYSARKESYDVEEFRKAMPLTEFIAGPKKMSTRSNSRPMKSFKILPPK